jgi:hypothetical protein
MKWGLLVCVSMEGGLNFERMVRDDLNEVTY